MFTILVASDVLGEKVNLEIPFSSRPNLKELTAVVEKCYEREIEERTRGRGKYQGAEYNVSRYQIFDESREKWADLSSASMLVDYCQIYAFQPPNPWHKEVRAPIPAPIKTSFATLAYSRTAANGRDTSTYEEKTASVFEEMDLQNKRLLSADDFQKTFALHGMELSSATILDIFTKCDANGDGFLSYTEFQMFSEQYPTLLDSLYHRLKHYWADMKFQEQMRAEQEQLERLRNALSRADNSRSEGSRGVQMASERISEQEKTIFERIENVRHLEDSLREAQRECDKAQKEVQNREADLALQHEKERLKETIYVDSQQEVEVLLRRFGNATHDSNTAIGKLRSLEKSHSDCQGELDREASKTSRAASDVENSKNALQNSSDAKFAASQGVDRLALELQDMDHGVAVAQQQETATRGAHQATVDGVDRAKGFKDDEDNNLESCRTTEQFRNAERLQSEQIASEQSEEVVLLEKENEAFLAKLSDLMQTEGPILEKEIKLREQRHNLEVKESVLRKDHKSFYEASYNDSSPIRSSRRYSSQS